MNHDIDETANQDVLELARQLERDCARLESGVRAEPVAASPDDYLDALRGLTLVRHASRVPMLKGDPPSTVHGEPTRIDDAGFQNVTDCSTRESTTELPRIGRFEVLRELGRGGFGVVLLAKDPKLNRLVALKVPRLESLIDPDARIRFEREAQLSSTLSHPAIVPIYESGMAGPISYIAFGYCRGRSLGAWFADHHRRVEPALAARIVAQLAQAVHYAHQRGVIHRDLKPANVLLDLDESSSADDAGALVAALRITDFGLAKWTQAMGPDLTRAGALVGTPSYMAPEQTAGRQDNVTPAADLYALGAMLYELLTGAPPFQRETDLDTLRAVESEEPRAPRRLRPEVSADLEAICLKCLEKSPARRYASAFLLQQDLEQWLENRPVTARRVGSLERAWRWCQRNPAMATAAGLVLTGLLATTWQWRRAEQNWSRAERHLEDANRQRERAERNLDRVERSIDKMLNDVAHVLKQVPQMEAFRTRLLEQALALEQELLADRANGSLSPLRSAQARRRIGELNRALGNHDLALDALVAAEKEMKALGQDTGADDRSAVTGELIKIQSELCAVHFRMGKYDAARQAAGRAIALFDERVELPTSPAFLRELSVVWRQLGMALEQSNQEQDARNAYLQSLSVLERISPADRDDESGVLEGQSLNSLGVLEARAGQVEPSEARYRESLAVLRPIAERSPERIDLKYNVAVTAINLANRYLARRDYPQAATYYQTAGQIGDALSDGFPQHESYLDVAIRAASGLGLCQFRTGTPQQALETFQKCLARARRSNAPGGESPAILSELAGVLTNQGNVYREALRDPQAADQSYREACAIYEKLLARSPDSAAYRRSYSLNVGNIALSKLTSGDLSGAQLEFQRSLREAESACALSPRDPRTLANAEWQLHKLCETQLRLGHVEPLLKTIDDFARQPPVSVDRLIAAVKALAACLDLTGNSSPHDNPAEPNPIAPLTPVDRDRMIDESIRYLTQAVEQGYDKLHVLANSKALTALAHDSRFRALVEK